VRPAAFPNCRVFAFVSTPIPIFQPSPFVSARVLGRLRLGISRHDFVVAHLLNILCGAASELIHSMTTFPSLPHSGGHFQSRSIEQLTASSRLYRLTSLTARPSLLSALIVRCASATVCNGAVPQANSACTIACYCCRSYWQSYSLSRV
jgi:hypothetical protein